MGTEKRKGLIHQTFSEKRPFRKAFLKLKNNHLIQEEVLNAE
jgi:hypothetical protein